MAKPPGEVNPPLGGACFASLEHAYRSLTPRMQELRGRTPRHLRPSRHRPTLRVHQWRAEPLQGHDEGERKPIIDFLIAGDPP
jgi:hypothetical protein